MIKILTLARFYSNYFKLNRYDSYVYYKVIIHANNNNVFLKFKSHITIFNIYAKLKISTSF